MRINSDAFDEEHQSGSLQPRYVIEIDFSIDGTDLHYFTSHDDIPAVTPVTHGVLKKTSSISQKLIPERANSTIGSLSFELLDSDDAVTAIFNDKRVNRKVLFGKRARLYIGFAGLEWADYRLEQTQFIDKKVKFKDGTYFVPCKDSSYGMNKNIMEPLETRLSASIVAADTAIPVYNVEGWQLVERDSNFSDAPSTTCTYLEINDGTNKEYCRVTGIGTDFTVVRGVLGTDARDWTLPVDANDEKGTKVKELILVEMSSLKLAYAVMTGELIGQTGTFPEHWHVGIDPSLLIESEFTNQDDFIAYAVGLQKTDAKKFIEAEIMLPNSRYLRVNGSGGMDLKRLFAINSEAAPVFNLDESEITKASDLEFDSATTFNKFSIEWSYDTKPKKPEYRRKSTFKFNDSATDYGEQEKSFKFRLINGVRATSTTLLNLINSFADRLAGEAARLKVSTFSSNNNIEVGDVGLITHSGIKNFNTGDTLNQSMQVISTKADQVKGEFSVELFGSTFTPEPLTDGTVRVLNDSFYTATSNQLPNVVSNSLNADTTLNGGDNHNNFVWEVDGDLTIPDGVTLTVTDNVQLRIKGQLTILGSINGIGNGRANGGGFIGTSIGRFGSSCRNHPVSNEICSRINGGTNAGDYESCPTFDLDNPDGLSVGGLPTDLRGSSGATGGDSVRYNVADEPFQDSPGGSGNPSGSACVIICRGMSLSGNGAVDMSGLQGNEAVPDGVTIGGQGGHSTPGALVVLLDGGTSSIPDLVGRITAMSYDPSSTNGRDLKQNATRVQFIPQARIPVEDDAILDSTGTLYTWVKYADDGNGVGLSNDPLNKSYLGLAYNKTTAVESNTPADYEWTKILGEDGQDGSDGIPGDAGADGQTLYTWVKYADDINGGGLSNTSAGKTHIGFAYNKTTATESNTASDYTWALFKGADGAQGQQGLQGLQGDQGLQGVEGPAGADGVSTYFHIAYADDDQGTGFSQTATNKDYIGTYVDTTEADAGSGSGLWNWQLVKGLDGQNGIPGNNGADGQTSYLHIAYANSSDGATGFSTTDSANKSYIGQYTDFVLADSTTPGDYAWTLILGPQGPQGPQGNPGADGIDGQPGTNGGDGNSVAQLTIYRRASSAPANPSGGSYNFTTNTITAPANWSSTIPAGSDPVYASHAIASVSGSTGTDSSLTWSSADLVIQNGSDGADGADGQEGQDGSNGSNGSNGSDGVDGRSTFQGMIFRRSASTPATPDTNSGSYNFGTNTLTPPANWSTTPPAGANPLYSSVATFSVVGTTGTDSTQTWTAPELFVQDGEDGSDGSNGSNGNDGSDGADGADGVSTYFYTIYRRSASAPSTPSGGSFNFGTNIPTAPTNWNTTIPAGSDPLYVSSALASVTGGTGTDSSLTWSTPVILAQNGDDGLGSSPILNSTNDPETGVSHTSIGNGILITWSFTEDSGIGTDGNNPPFGNITLSLKRGSTTIDSVVVVAEKDLEPGSQFWSYASSARTINDTPGSGTYTYSVTTTASSSDPSTTGGSISTREEQ